jgi:hypothetical protein
MQAPELSTSEAYELLEKRQSEKLALLEAQNKELKRLIFGLYNGSVTLTQALEAAQRGAWW